MDKKELRSGFRKLRQKLSESEQLLAAHELTLNLFKLDVINNANHIAGYWPNDGEISPLLFLEQAMRQGKKCYLPLIIGENTLMLDFASYTTNDQLLKNNFGIFEPNPLKQEVYVTNLESLDVILVPLVAFDLKGSRLGMGAGYYDATLSRLIDVEPAKRPVIIGLGHDCQQYPNLPVDDWDWSLNIVVTDKNIFYHNAQKNH
jgi:5-formyltetrahydrofolate cyclo-ligase